MSLHQEVFSVVTGLGFSFVALQAGEVGIAKLNDVYEKYLEGTFTTDQQHKLGKWFSQVLWDAVRNDGLPKRWDLDSFDQTSYEAAIKFAEVSNLRIVKDYMGKYAYYARTYREKYGGPAGGAGSLDEWNAMRAMKGAPAHERARKANNSAKDQAIRNSMKGKK